MHIKELVPEDDKRMFFAGMNGSGKTSLMQKIIYELEDDGALTIIIDTDRMWDYQKWWKFKYKKHIPIEITSSDNLNQLKPGTYIYRAKYPAIDDPFVKKILVWSIKRGSNTIVIDELTDFSKGNNIMFELGRLIKQGRKKHVRILIGTQRPSSIPLIAITESRYFAVFELQSENDRERLATWVHELFFVKVTGHDFQFYKPGLQQPILIRQSDKAKDKKGKNVSAK